MAGHIALVTGGCGCVGYHIVKELLSDPSFDQVHVFSRNPTRNLLPNVKYHAGSITSTQDVASVLETVKPTVIFHTASPVSAGSSASQKLFYNVNVEGTKTLLENAVNSTVKAFVYTSSSTVVLGPHRHTIESAPLITESNNPEPFNYYTLTKALADAAVLKANGIAGLLTCSLRIASIYGDRDAQMIPGLILQIKEKRTTTQIGKNDQPMDFLSASNSARAHLLAAKALLRGPSDGHTPKVDGEAFFITDDSPICFWDFARKVWRAAGDQTSPEEVKVMPGWLVLGIAVTVEWIYWVFTLGTRTPEFLRSHTIRFVTDEKTFNCEKAKERLAYKAFDDRDESIQAGVEYCFMETHSTRETNRP